MDFDAAFHKLLGHEGGYVDHPADPGGATNWGITVAVARENGYTGDMKDLTTEQAKAIYRLKYWNAVRCNDIQPGVRYAVFDAAVNSGVHQAALWLQRAVGAAADGKIGPQTILAANTRPSDQVVRRMLAQRLRFMTDLRQWQSFGRGWARRIADLMEDA